MSTRRGSLFALSAPSGSGKTTLVHGLLESLDEIRFSVSYTTRTSREGERDGVDYHFVSEEAFRQKIGDGELLEWAEVHGNLYGTARAETERVRAAGEDVILDVDVQGAAQVRKAQPDAVTLFILPPSFAILEERLRGRNQDPEDVITVRLEQARHEIRHYEDYDFVLINDSVEQTLDLLRAIVLAERSRPHLQRARLEPILESFHP